MKKIFNLLFVLAVPVLFILLASGTLYHNGSPGNKTGSPGDGGANCTECHLGTPTQEEFWIFNGDLVLYGYQPSQVYLMTVVGVDPDANKFGFEATVEDESGNPVGTLQLFDPSRTQLINSNTSVTHTAAGNVPLADTGTAWFFNWVAPAAPVGNVGFYVAVNAANGNGQNTGDQIHLSSFMASPSVSIAESNENKPFNFYPNPSNGMINLTNNKSSDDQEIKIFNIGGQIIYETRLIAGQNSRIDLSRLENGIYIIRANEYSERLVIR
ncbi:MAG: T9SS type A sorting domain-containing protein [Bacteroidales bacterium]|nr:T9SS type A sorting domain-containing protein [Bacteroidales bacterium]